MTKMKGADKEEIRNWIASMEDFKQRALPFDDTVDGREIDSWESDRVEALERLIAGLPKMKRLLTHHNIIPTPKDKDCERGKKLFLRAMDARKKRYEIINKHRSRIGLALAMFWVSVEVDMLRDLAKIFASLREKYQI
jgi:hypothetical protein